MNRTPWTVIILTIWLLPPDALGQQVRIAPKPQGILGFDRSTPSH
jgi:hypothetical protein